MANVIPHLSRDGYMSNPIEMITKLFQYYIIADYSQSNTFRGNIASLKYNLYDGKTIEDKKNNIIVTLTTLYERYFSKDNVIVEVEVEDNDPIYIFNIRVEVIYNGVTYTLNNNILTSNNYIADIEAAIEDINIS